jgi:hypothetical protein
MTKPIWTLIVDAPVLGELWNDRRGGEPQPHDQRQDQREQRHLAPLPGQRLRTFWDAIWVII